MNTKKEKLVKVWGLYAAFITLAAAPALAQNEQAGPPSLLENEAPTLRFEHLGLKDGLEQNSIHTMIQDSTGFIWIGTGGGVQRYDGHNFKLYSITPFDTTSLSDSFVFDLAEANNGDLWVATNNGGLNRLDPATGRAIHYRYDPADSTSLASDYLINVLQASNGDVWVATWGEGLDRMRTGDRTRFIHYHPNPGDSATLTADSLFYLSEGPDGSIWAGSTNGVNQIDPQTGTVRRYLYTPEAAPNGTSPEVVFKAYLPAENPGIAWLATGNGLVRLETESGAYERFLVASNKNGRSPHNQLSTVVPDPNDPAILWATGSATGLARFDTRTETFTSYRHDPQDPHSLSTNYGLSLMADRSGTMWIGTSTDGLNTFNPGAVNFTHLRSDSDDPLSLAPGIIWGLYAGRDGTLWAGGQQSQDVGYLTRIDPSGRIRRYRHQPPKPQSIQAGFPQTFAEDSSGNLWIGHAPLGGLSRLDRATGRLTHFGHKRTPANRGRNAINVLLPTMADSNVLWVASYSGLDRFDTRTGRFIRVALHLKDAGNELAAWSLYQNVDSTLWVGTNKGLIRLNPATGATRAFTYHAADTTTINNNLITGITARAGKPGILWLATPGGGLNRFDTRTGTTTHYTTREGLANNIVYGILEDNSGTLWMSTNNGISNFDPKTKAFRNYGLDDGLMALEYSQNGFTKGADGTLYFGSGKGITAFKPENLHTNTIPPQVVFTGLKISNKTVTPGPDSPLSRPLTETDSLTLAYNQNEVTFNFVALHFANPAKNTYAYRLNGFDNDWVQAGTRSEATYTNLSPGNYTFNVKAANADGVWNEKGASLHLTVLPPWWRTWWAYGLFALLICAGIFAVDRVQRRRLITKESERARERELEQARKTEQAYAELQAAKDQLVQQEKLASLGQLTAGIAHEIKNPLNFVNNFSEVSMELIEEIREELSNQLSAVSDQQTADVKSEKSPFEGGAEAKAEVGDVRDGHKLILKILNDIEANLSKIHEHGSRADSIVKSMLQHSRGGTGKMEPTDINALIKEYVNLSFHGMRAGKNPINVDIEFKLDKNVGTVPLIAEDFSRVIVNLCNNAFDAMKEKADVKGEMAENYLPKFTVQTKQANNKIFIKIADNGPGISEEIRDKILQPFFTTKKGIEGTGLGLSITHDIVKAQGGELKFKSAGDKGAAFIITLPRGGRLS